MPGFYQVREDCLNVVSGGCPSHPTAKEFGELSKYRNLEAKNAKLVLLEPKNTLHKLFFLSHRTAKSGYTSIEAFLVLLNT